MKNFTNEWEQIDQYEKEFVGVEKDSDNKLTYDQLALQVFSEIAHLENLQ